MIVPSFWAEARFQRARSGKIRSIDVRRFGWSDVSQADAERHAQERVQAAVAKIETGEKVARREFRTAYNGADGVPIREEVLARHGDTVITRNGYGAHCLNTPEVLFADIDFPPPPQAKWGCPLAMLVMAAWLAAAFALAGRQPGMVLALVGLVAAPFVFLGLRQIERRVRARRQPDPESAVRARVEAFLRAHRDWGVRLYRTPAGLRLLATHAVFDPADPRVGPWFDALGVDAIYKQMCQSQRCFRARLTPKPWRIDLRARLGPHAGPWPTPPQYLRSREIWVEQYEAKARGYAACRFVAALGARTVHPKVEPVRELHDRLAQATSGRLIA